MALLQTEDIQFLTENFAQLAEDVTLTVHTREASRLILPGQEPEEGATDTSAEARQIAGEVAATSPRLKLVLNSAEPGERTPSIRFSSEKSKGKLTYYGLPAGYEMSTLVAAILDLGSGEPPIPEEISARLTALAKPIHIQVFVTPSCPHCPAMARVAFQLAMMSDQITADVVEVQEFPEVAQRYEIRGVPMTVVNDVETLMGRVPPMQLIEAVEKVAGATAAP